MDLMQAGGVSRYTWEVYRNKEGIILKVFYFPHGRGGAKLLQYKSKLYCSTFLRSGGWVSDIPLKKLA